MTWRDRVAEGYRVEARTLSSKTAAFLEESTCEYTAEMPDKVVLNELKPYRLKTATKLYRALKWENLRQR